MDCKTILTYDSWSFISNTHETNVKNYTFIHIQSYNYNFKVDSIFTGCKIVHCTM